ncbi:aminopeptidase [Spartinivicinus poritis]|uniref:Aminopeptidase n=1 Tax=Spartinivicinus poritis TaxID=2994640 RepID=A0ABT5U8L7_9GAMM|nr:aminopeptidase [Spartinivicinus sp. A2-2]MDE1462727.1 aminopeptidase [Spartinivicinus sp. A2-2]
MNFQLNQQVCGGVESLINDYAKISIDDLVIMTCTEDSVEPVALVSESLKLKGIKHHVAKMNPLNDEALLYELTCLLPSAADLQGNIVFMTFEKNTMSHNNVFRRILMNCHEKKCRVIRVISACYDFFAQSLAVTPEILSRRNTTILEKLMKAKELVITTKSGTSLKVTLDNNRYRWISNRGIIKDNSFMMLPAGEVATFPNNINGVLVAEFAFNVNILTDVDARLVNNPVSVTIEDGQAVDFQCENKQVTEIINYCFNNENGKLVGELGFGTNIGIKQAISLNSHINERVPGIHLGFGDHNQLPEVAKYSCSSHLDLICQGGEIWVDSDHIPIDLQNIRPSINKHPENLYTEDLKSPVDQQRVELDDCCGLIK